MKIYKDCRLLYKDFSVFQRLHSFVRIFLLYGDFFAINFCSGFLTEIFLRRRAKYFSKLLTIRKHLAFLKTNVGKLTFI